MLFVCTALFFSFLYPAHIRFQEQYQLFEFAGDYFLHTVSVPGGFSDWCGRFLTQFFAIPWLGALVTASLSTAAYVLCRRLLGGGSLLHLLLSLVPAILLSVMFLADEYLPGAAVALLFSLSAAVAIRSMDRSYIRTFLSLVIPAALYFLAGPAAVLTALLIPRDERLAVRIFASLPVLLLPLLCQFFCHIPLESLYIGVHYVRIPDMFPSALWMTALGVIAISCIDILAVKGHGKTAVPAAAMLISASLFMLWKTTDFEKEETMRYDFMAENEDWDGIIRTARKSAPANALSTGCLNLALACSGQLPDRQFSYPQSGEKGLFPSYSISYRSLPAISEIYWHLGMVNACQQYIFDAQEAIPDFQKSARCYKRLAETGMINGDYGVAMKYLDALSNTLFYRRWARDAKTLLASPERIDGHAVYGRLRRLRDDNPVTLFNENNKYAMCLDMVRHNPDNDIARQYMYSLLLLEKDMEGFLKVFDEDRYMTLPKHYQEALALICVNERKPLASVSGLVSENNLKRMRGFIRDMKSNLSEESMKKKYGDTYWYYSIFR